MGNNILGVFDAKSFSFQFSELAAFLVLKSCKSVYIAQYICNFEILTLWDEISLVCSSQLVDCVVSFKKQTVGQMKEDIMVACSLSV